MDVIVNFVVLRSPPQTCIRFREKFLDNATAWAIDSTNVIDTFLFDSCSPPQTCRRFKEKIVGQPRWLGSWLNKCHWHILLNDSLLLFYSPPQTCKRFKEKIVRECRSMRQFDCNSWPLDAGERSFNPLSFSCADLRLRKTLSTVSECHPLRQCTWEEHGWLLLNVAIYANDSKLNCFDSFCWPNECQSRNSNRQVVGSLLLSDCAWVALSSAMVTECRAKRKQFSTFSVFVWCNKCQSRSLSRQFVVPVSLPDCARKANISNYYWTSHNLHTVQIFKWF